MVPYAARLIPLLVSKNTRVRWEATHALALVARLVPDVVAKVLDTLARAIWDDKSVIVRDYSILTLGEYASTGAEAARSVGPILVRSLTELEGRHAALALEALAKAAGANAELAADVIALAREYREDPKARVSKAARATLKRLGD